MCECCTTVYLFTTEQKRLHWSIVCRVTCLLFECVSACYSIGAPPPPPSWWGAGQPPPPPSQWRRLRRGYTHSTIRWAVWTCRPDCINLGRYRVRVQKRMYNDCNDDNNNNNISFVCLSFRMLFVFLSIFLVFLFYPVHAQQTRVYDRAPDGMLEFTGLYLYDIFVSFFFLRFYFSVLIFFFNHKRGHSVWKIYSWLESTHYSWCSGRIDKRCSS